MNDKTIISQRKTVLDGVVLEEAYPAEPDLTYEQRLAIVKEQYAQACQDFTHADEWYQSGRITWAEYKRLHEQLKELFWDMQILDWKVILERKFGHDRARLVQP